MKKNILIIINITLILLLCFESKSQNNKKDTNYFVSQLDSSKYVFKKKNINNTLISSKIDTTMKGQCFFKIKDLNTKVYYENSAYYKKKQRYSIGDNKVIQTYSDYSCKFEYSNSDKNGKLKNSIEFVTDTNNNISFLTIKDSTLVKYMVFGKDGSLNYYLECDSSVPNNCFEYSIFGTKIIYMPIQFTKIDPKDYGKLPKVYEGRIPVKIVYLEFKNNQLVEYDEEEIDYMQYFPDYSYFVGY